MRFTNLFKMRSPLVLASLPAPAPAAAVPTGGTSPDAAPSSAGAGAEVDDFPTEAGDAGAAEGLVNPVSVLKKN